MKRDNLYRGKTPQGKWVEGSLLQSEIAVNGHCVCEIHTRFADCPSLEFYTVIPETVGQYSTKKDKDGKRIFEGDINNDKGFLEWNTDDASFVWNYNGELVAMEAEDEWCTIIGNIHDNPEMLEVKP